MKNFFTEGMFGFMFGKRGFFSRPSEVEFKWRLGDTEKANNNEGISGRANTSNFKCDVKIKI